MNTAGLMGGIGGALFTVILLYVFRAKGSDLSRRRTIVFGILGTIFLVFGLLLVIVKGEALLSIAIPFLLFGVTCLMFSEVYRSLRKLQEKGVGESSSQKLE